MALLVAVFLGFGLRLSALGLYWDDWPYLWFFHVLGPAGMYNSLGADRPLLGVLYALTLSVLGSSPLAWQIFALLMRWLCALGFWLALRQAWPKRSAEVLWAALLFSIFPGFTQHWISVVWGNAYVLYAFLFFSLALTTWAVKDLPRRWPAVLLGLALSGYTMFSTEYFYGLELLRPVLAWLALAGLPRGSRLRRAAVAWAPFLVLMVVFAAWRIIHPFGGGGSEGLLTAVIATPLTFLASLPPRILHDLAEGFLGAWGLAFNYAPLIESGGLELAGLALGTGLLAWVYLARLQEVPAPSPDASNSPSGGHEKTDHWALQAALLGLFAFFAAGWPFWLTRLPYTTFFPWDRFALVYSPGVCLVTAALIHWLFRGSTPVRRAFLAALLIGLSIGVQNAQASVFRTEWNDATDLFWQLSWRAPAIQPGSALLFDQIGLRYFEDDSLTGPLNWTYTPKTTSSRLDYIFLNIPERIRMMNDLNRDVVIQKDFRAMAFTGTTNQAVVVKFNPPGCLQVLDPLRDASRADLSEFERRALPLSRPDLIMGAIPTGADPATPPSASFGPEPRHKWCYYYERASLAAQYDRWNEILTLRNQSIGQGIFARIRTNTCLLSKPICTSTPGTMPAS